jgi:hypothetical protein
MDRRTLAEPIAPTVDLADGGDWRTAGRDRAFGLYLLERTDDQTVADIPADRVYTGSLNNSGEALDLVDPSGNVIDTANSGGGPWPAGDASSRASMERHGALDLAGSWSTFPGIGGSGLDANGNAIPGTPRHPNAPMPTATTPASELTLRT